MEKSMQGGVIWISQSREAYLKLPIAQAICLKSPQIGKASSYARLK